MGLIKNFETLAKTPQRKIVLGLIEEALASIQPEKVLTENVSLQENVLKIRDNQFDLSNFERIFLIGFGKGSAAISKIIEGKLGDKLTEGFVIDLEVPTETESKIKFTKGTHPLPSQTNLDFTKEVVDNFENKVSGKDLVLVIVCGGGSALFELPKDLSLDELVRKNNELLKSGLTIEQMNIERKKMSRVKGGGLAKILVPSKVVGLIFSDVPGNDISVISSGPTDDPSATNILMLSNETVLMTMAKKAGEAGVTAKIYSDKFQSDARDAGRTLIEACESGSILLVGGETTLKVTGKGKGGRNQEVVLNALKNIDSAIIASFDSDGWDNSEAAGAIGDLQTVEEAKKQNLNVEEFLANNNSFEFFQKTGDAILTGRLPSNVSDLIIVYKHG